jgi:hypothetical protein
MLDPSGSLSLGYRGKAMSLIVPGDRGTMKANNDDCSAPGADDEDFVDGNGEDG